MGFHPFAISIAKIRQCRGEVGNNEKWRDGWDVVLSEGKESILWGETMWCVATADIALFSRLIFLTLPKSDFSAEEKEAYQLLKKVRGTGMSHLTLQILSFRNKVDSTFKELYNATLQDVIEKLKDNPIEDRILLNWIGPLAMLRTLENYIDVSITYKEMQKITIDGIKHQNSECRQNSELASFWNMVQYLVSEGEIIDGGDYKIEYVRNLKSSICTQQWLESRPVLLIQKTRVFMLYKKYGKDVGDTLLPEGSLKYYLENSKAYLGEKTARYDVYHKGILQYAKNEKKVGGSLIKQTTTHRSYCFDYSKIAESFDVNFEKTKIEANCLVNDDEISEDKKQAEFDF